MNKELILKYKIEFDHWLNGGKLLAYYKTDEEPKWWSDEESINYDGDDNFSSIIKNSLSPSDVLIVIDDSYSIYRKALAEGKVIQLNEAEKFSDQNRGWVDLSCTSLGSSTNLFPVEYYRIKPEEPKFKVGDWVYYSKKENNTPMRIDKIDEDWVISNINFTYKHYTAEYQLELWQPQPGEWCWTKHNEQTCLIQYHKGRAYYDLEPFIGNLPTFIKE